MLVFLRPNFFYWIAFLSKAEWGLCKIVFADHQATKRRNTFFERQLSSLVFFFVKSSFFLSSVFVFFFHKTSVLSLRLELIGSLFQLLIRDLFRRFLLTFVFSLRKKLLSFFCKNFFLSLHIFWHNRKLSHSSTTDRKVTSITQQLLKPI